MSGVPEQVTVTFIVAEMVPPAGTLRITDAAVKVAFVNCAFSGLVVEGETVEVRVTLLATPAWLFRVIVDVANEVVLLVRLRETGLAVIENGTTLVEILVERESPPPVPVTLIEYALTAVVAVEETVKVAVTVPPDGTVTTTVVPVEVPLLNVIVGPFTRLGVTVKERVTFAVNVLILVRVRVVELEEPNGFTNEAGLAAILKSGTRTVMFRLIWWMRLGVPPLAFTIRS